MLSKEANEVNFNSLPPGDYQFKLRIISFGQNLGDRDWNYSFKIRPAFWRTWWFLLISVVLAFLVLLLIFRSNRRRNRNRQNLIRSQLTALKAQMNPHFIFNTMNVLQEFIIDNDSRLANKHLSQFSRLIRNVIKYSDQDLITLREEIELVEIYLSLEKVRMDGKLDYHIETAEEVRSDELSLPPLLIQPYIDAAITERLMHKAEDRKLNLHISLHGSSAIKLVIRDNGIAPDSDSKMTTTVPETIELTNQRLSLLNKQNQISIKVSNEQPKDHDHLHHETQLIISVKKQD